MLLKEMEQFLRKRNIQIEFLELGGLDVLANWINQNPDGSFPLPQVVESVFQILDHFPITSEILENSKIAKVVSLYAHGKTELRYMQHTALTLIQKWQSIVYNLSYQYDKEGFHEQKQRDLRQRIHAIKARDQSNADQMLVDRDPNGQIMMKCSHFDFIEKPHKEVSPVRVGKSNMAKQEIEKAFKKMDQKKNQYQIYM
jgi:hypothetical protein